MVERPWKQRREEKGLFQRDIHTAQEAPLTNHTPYIHTYIHTYIHAALIICAIVLVCMYDIQSVCMYVEEIPTKPSARYLLLAIKTRLGQVSRTVLLVKYLYLLAIHTYIHTYMAACLWKQRHSDHSRTGTAARDQTRPDHRLFQRDTQSATPHTYIHGFSSSPCVYAPWSA